MQARVARAIMGVFLRELNAHKMSKHLEEAKYIYQQHKNGYPGVCSSTPELYLYELDPDFMAQDGETAFTPDAS